MPLQSISEDKVRHVAALAVALSQVSQSSALGLDHSAPDTAERMFKYMDSPEHKALVDYLTALSDDERAELMAIMWLGRGDSGTDLIALTEKAKKESDASDVNYIAGKAPALPEYFNRGLAAAK